MRDPVHALVDAALAVSPESLPQAAVAAAKRLLADSLAVAFAGRGCRDTEAVFALASQWGGRPECVVLGSTLRAPAPVAALVNGTMIQALDFDDTDDASAAHTASTVLAAALAVGESRARSGGELLAALVAGVEVVARLGRASTDNIGFTSSSLYGVFGAAIAASRLLRLTPQQARHALGIALSQAAGSTQTALDWPLSKHMQSGFAAQAGVLAALLAEQDVSGIEEVFEGRFGFFNLYKGGRRTLEPLLEAWTKPFAIEGLSLKPYPSCRATHGPVDACETLVRAHGVRAQEVDRVRVTVPALAFMLAGQGVTEGRDPVIAAQFSIAYTVAAALVHGDLRLRDFRAEAVANPVVRALAERVSVEVAEGADFVPARVEIVLRDGRSVAQVVERLKGSPKQPLGETELRAKIDDCLAFAPVGCTRIDTEGLLQLAGEIDRIDVAQLMARLRPPEPRIASRPLREALR